MATKQEIFNAGRERGRNVVSWIDIPEIGSPIDKSIDFVGYGDTVTEANLADYMETLAFEAESNSRQFSPFEFTAQELNEMNDSKSYDVWAVFEDGILRGIRESIRKRTRQARSA